MTELSAQTGPFGVNVELLVGDVAALVWEQVADYLANNEGLAEALIKAHELRQQAQELAGYAEELAVEHASAAADAAFEDATRELVLPVTVGLNHLEARALAFGLLSGAAGTWAAQAEQKRLAEQGVAPLPQQRSAA